MEKVLVLGMGMKGLEPLTIRLSSVYSDQLSYIPATGISCFSSTGRRSPVTEKASPEAPAVPTLYIRNTGPPVYYIDGPWDPEGKWLSG